MAHIHEAVEAVYYSPSYVLTPHNLLVPSPILRYDADIHPLTASVEDCSFGDSGKGHIVQELNRTLAARHPDGIVFSYRWNGSANAGHEVWEQGVRIATHQVPVAALQERATAIMGRGELIHPTDLVTEIAYIEKSLGSRLPGTLLIDKYATMTHDLHRAFEGFQKKLLGVGKGSTGSGVAQGYSSFYEKRAVLMDHFIDNTWREKLGTEYDFYATLMGGEDAVAGIMVNALTIDGKRSQHPIGRREEFLDRMEVARSALLPYVVDVYPLFADAWHDPRIPKTFEGSQGGALDPYHGIYSDVTASRPLGRVGIPDSTEGIVLYEQIALRTSTIKVPYMSSVGERRPPYAMADKIAQMYRDENDERGRSTGRDRDVLPIDLVLMQYIHRVAGYQFLAVTHMDSAHQDIPIEVVVAYRDKQTGKEVPYRPSQMEWDKVEGVKLTLPSWDGAAAAKARSVEDLPYEALQFMDFLGRTLAPVALVTNGPKRGEMISFLT